MLQLPDSLDHRLNAASHLPNALCEESRLQGHKQRQSQLKALVRDDVAMVTKKMFQNT